MSSVTFRRVLKSLAPRLCNALRFSGVRFLCESSTPRPSPKAAVQSFGVLLDIDGVLVRGRNPIPGAREALQMLQQSEVPTVFLTNGGCESEKETAERISHRIGFEVFPCNIVFKKKMFFFFGGGGGGYQGYSQRGEGGMVGEWTGQTSNFLVLTPSMLQNLFLFLLQHTH